MKLTLKSGREIDIPFGFLSINDQLEIGTGYDQVLTLYDADYNDAPLNKDERAEIADRMIELWRRWRDASPD